MENITGFNPTLAKKDIQNFIEKYDKAAKTLMDIFKNNGIDLASVWYSPHAVEFMNDYHRFRVLINKRLYTTKDTIVSRTVDSFNIFAKANGFTAIDISSLNSSLIINTDDLEKIDFKPMDNNGVVRMSADYIKNTLIPLLRSGVNKSISEFSDLPMDIAFYDPEGKINLLFKKLIISLVDTIKEISSEVIDIIKLELETDVEMVTKAVSEAVSSLDNNA